MTRLAEMKELCQMENELAALPPIAIAEDTTKCRARPRPAVAIGAVS
jgi:hypothetical protein